MTIATWRALALAAGLSALATGGAAAETPAADAPAVATAVSPTTAADTARQIDAYLASSPAAELPKESAPGVTEREAPQIHGEASVTVGSHGLRSGYVSSEMPLGQTGSLAVAVQATRIGSGPWAGDYRGLDVALRLGDATGDTPGRACSRPGSWSQTGPRTFGDPAGRFAACQRGGSVAPAWVP
jgi:hypothetical protein